MPSTKFKKNNSYQAKSIYNVPSTMQILDMLVTFKSHKILYSVLILQIRKLKFREVKQLKPKGGGDRIQN